MSLRLLKVLVAREAQDEVMETLEKHGAAPRWTTEVVDGRVMIDVVLHASGNEPVLDDLEARFRGDERFRLLFFPLEATVPRMKDEDEEEDEDDDEDDTEDQDREHRVGEQERAGDEGAAESESVGAQASDESQGTERPPPAVATPPAPGPGPPGADPSASGGSARGAASDAGSSAGPAVPDAVRREEAEATTRRVPSRINREELYADISELSRANFYFMIMSGLSSVVATAGLLLGDGAVIIGAMVIAPLIGPSIGTAFATTLGDLELGWSTLKASVWGALVAFAVAFLAGLVFPVDPFGTEILGRTRLTFEHLALALAAGAAGALAITQGKGAGLVGVMVAVALLPPLANAGLLLGDGHLVAGAGALVLMVGNVVSVNLAATITFLALGVRPNTWWEEGIRSRAIWTASILWGVMLLVLAAVVWFAWGGEAPGLPG